MTGKILHCLRVYSGMDQVSDVGVPQLVRCDLKIQAVNDILPIHALLSGFRLELLLDSLTVHVFIESTLMRATNSDIVPNPIELRV